MDQKKVVAERALNILKGYNPPPVSKTTGQGAFGMRGYEFEGTNAGMGQIKLNHDSLNVITPERKKVKDVRPQ